MKNKISNLVFSVLFMGILILPVIFLNTKENQISGIDNRVLAEWPGITWNLSSKSAIEDFLDDRIGFREEMIEAYIELNDKLFHVMEHPLFMYGEDGHIFFKDASYIAGYQRLNTDAAFLDSMVGFLEQTQDYLESKNIEFLYFLCPDKKTIYPEYFPKSIHVKTDNESVIEHMRSALSSTDVNYIIPDRELLEAKKSQVVYNRKYDATHWNEFGAMLGHKLIDERIQEWFDDVPPLSEDDFDLSYKTMETLDVAKFPIHEEVPSYTLKNELGQDSTGYLEPYLHCTTTSFYTHYQNPNAGNGKILLVFTDSYFAGYTRFYTNRFSEVYFVHRQNYDYLQYLVNLTFPDVVIFETAERSIMGEMAENANFNDYYYEPAYPGSADFSTGEKPSYLITTTKGVRRDGTTLYLNTEAGENIISLTGRLNQEDGRIYNVYAHVGEVYLEADYCALHRLSAFDNLNEFSFSVQRRYMAQGPIELIAVDAETGEQYLLDTFEVVYE